MDYFSLTGSRTWRLSLKPSSLAPTILFLGIIWSLVFLCPPEDRKPRGFASLVHASFRRNFPKVHEGGMDIILEITHITYLHITWNT